MEGKSRGVSQEAPRWKEELMERYDRLLAWLLLLTMIGILCIVGYTLYF